MCCKYDKFSASLQKVTCVPVSVLKPICHSSAFQRESALTGLLKVLESPPIKCEKVTA